MMTFISLAKDYGIEPNDLWKKITTIPKKEKFFNTRVSDFNEELDSVTVHAIEEIMGHKPVLKENETTPSNSILSENEKNTTFEECMNKPIMDTEAKVSENNDTQNETSQNIQEENALQKKESVTTDGVIEKQKTRKRKGKTQEISEIETDIDKVPGVLLRKFYAENFTIKPEKIFFMDDNMVKNVINEKYAVIEQGDNFLFIKKSAAIISVKKDV